MGGLTTFPELWLLMEWPEWLDNVAEESGKKFMNSLSKSCWSLRRAETWTTIKMKRTNQEPPLNMLRTEYLTVLMTNLLVDFLDGFIFFFKLTQSIKKIFIYMILTLKSRLQEKNC